MSPAVGPGGNRAEGGGAAAANTSMPPRPPSEGNGPPNGSSPASGGPPPRPPHQGGPPMSGPPGPPTSGAYPPPPPSMGPPPGQQHMMYNSKLGPGGAPPPGAPGGPPPPPNQQFPPYGAQPNSNYNYAGQRMPGGHPGYGPYPGYRPNPNAMPPGQYYPGQPYPPQGGWQNPGPPGMINQSGKPLPPGAAGPPPPRQQYPQRPSHPGMKPYPGGNHPPPNAPGQNNYNGPPNYSGPPGMPPPPGSNPGSSPSYPGSYPPGMNNYPGMGPPNNSAPPPPPTSTTPNSHPPSPAAKTPSESEKPSPVGQTPPVTSPVTTTGSDGVPIHDDTSQQSTLSQSSDRSDGGRQTPKTTPNFSGYPPPPGSPHSSAPSPGAGSMGSSSHESGYPRDMASPNWQRTPASPVSGPQIFNSHVGNTPLAPPPGSETPTFRAKGGRGADNLSRLYELDDHPERRVWLDKLLAFMEDKGTPITQCPTISKNPLDLYKLYIYTRDRGGYLECTKNKSWKDIAAQLGIGASSSGAYTLKKHYGKNLLPFECYFDRGGCDPGPILAQVEAQTKKKTTKNTPSQPPPAPSPGSQDSRDSYSGSTTNSQEGYPPGAAGPPTYANTPPYNNYPPPGPPGSAPSNNDRPPSHPGMQPQHTKEPIRLVNPFDDSASSTSYSSSSSYNRAGMGPYPPPGPPPPASNSAYGYPPQRHPGPDGYPPPSNYPPYPGGPRPHWPPPHPQSGYMGGPPTGPPHPNGNAPPPGPPQSSAPGGPPQSTATTTTATSQPPSQSHPPPGGPPGGPPPPPQSNSDYNRPSWNNTPGGPPIPPPGGLNNYGPRGPYPPPLPSSSVTNNVPPSQPPQNNYPGQPPYSGPPDQFQPKLSGVPPPPPPKSLGPSASAQPPPPPNSQSIRMTSSVPPSIPTTATGHPPGSPGGPPSMPPHGPPVPTPTPAGAGPPLPPEGSRPVILRANNPSSVNPPSNASPNQFPPTANFGSLPPPNKNYNSGSNPPNSNPSTYGPSGKQPPPPPPPGPRGPPGNYPPFSGQRPPMYPGGGQPGWQNRYPGPGFPDRSNWGPAGPPTSGPRGSQNSWSERPTGPNQFPYGTPPSGPPGSWNSNSMRPRPPFRPDIRASYISGGPSNVPRPNFPGRGRELAFPPGSVEATQPLLLKRRKYSKLDVQPVDGWKLVMTLKSGLLMESTWALDVLNILLYDDNAFTYFGLSNMPGLLEVLLEHWRASLIEMFGITQDLELKDSVTRNKRRKRLKKESESLFAEEDPEEADLGRVSQIDMSDKVTVLNSENNFTKKPRFAEEDQEFRVELKDDALFIADGLRKWDTTVDDYIESGTEHWAKGGGHSTSHIVPGFTSGDLGILQFVRVMQEINPQNKSINKDIKKEEQFSTTSSSSSSSSSSEKQKQPNNNDTKVTGDDETKTPKEEETEEDIIDKIKRLTGIVFRDPDGVRSRWKQENLEDENYMRDEPSLHLVSDTQDGIGKRCLCISTILRNLSFLPGNEYEFSKNATFLIIAGRLLLLYHWHPPRTIKQRNYDRGEEDDTNESCTSLTGDDEWWWDYLHVIRENVMVALANISGALDLKQFDSDLIHPILSGLLEWAVSSSAYAQDPFPNVGPHSPISPQRLAIEALCKLSLLESNVDLILSTPPYHRIEKLTRLLAKKLYRYEDQVLREFSINLLYYLSGADSGVARTIATADMTIGLLLGFIEQAEQNALVVAQQHGVNALRDNPDSMGTSLDMLRRAASTLSNLSRHPDNIPLFLRQEQRLLSLVMSQILDQGVAAILSNVLFHIGKHSPKLVQQKNKTTITTVEKK